MDERDPWCAGPSSPSWSRSSCSRVARPATTRPPPGRLHRRRRPARRRPRRAAARARASASPAGSRTTPTRRRLSTSTATGGPTPLTSTTRPHAGGRRGVRRPHGVAAGTSSRDFNSASGQSGRSVLFADVTGQGELIALASDGRQVQLYGVSACQLVPEKNVAGRAVRLRPGLHRLRHRCRLRGRQRRRHARPGRAQVVPESQGTGRSSARSSPSPGRRRATAPPTPCRPPARGLADEAHAESPAATSRWPTNGVTSGAMTANSVARCRSQPGRHCPRGRRPAHPTPPGDRRGVAGRSMRAMSDAFGETPTGPFLTTPPRSRSWTARWACSRTATGCWRRRASTAGRSPCPAASCRAPASPGSPSRPTHRRRGVLTAIMRRQLDRAARAGARAGRRALGGGGPDLRPVRLRAGQPSAAGSPGGAERLRLRPDVDRAPAGWRSSRSTTYRPARGGPARRGCAGSCRATSRATTRWWDRRLRDDARPAARRAPHRGTCCTPRPTAR